MEKISGEQAKEMYKEALGNKSLGLVSRGILHRVWSALGNNPLVFKHAPGEILEQATKRWPKITSSPTFMKMFANATEPSKAYGAVRSIPKETNLRSQLGKVISRDMLSEFKGYQGSEAEYLKQLVNLRGVGASSLKDVSKFIAQLGL